MSDEKIIIDPRFCGPPDVGNGGYVAGLLAARLEGTVEVRLRAPAALDHPLVVRATDDGVELLDGGQRVATARRTVLDLDVPAPPAFAEAQERAGSCRAFQTHPFPRCFVCGPTPANAAPDASSPSVLASGGNGGATLLLISAPKISVIVFAYCAPVISRTRNGDALPAGSAGSPEQPATTEIAARTGMNLMLRECVNTPALPHENRG